MTTNPYQDIAKEFVDLWQKQMSAVMGDKQFIHAMLDMFKNMQTKQNAQTNASASDSASTSASEHGVLTELAFRLAMCEKRLAALEGKQSESKKTDSRKSTKRSSGRSKNPNK